MGQFDFRRIMPSLMGAAGASAATYALGAPLFAMFPALFAGGLAAWLATQDRTLPSSTTTELHPFDEGSTVLAELIEAFGDPLLVVDRQQVSLANKTAINLLGAHVLGENVRLAIRHPAVAERLSGDAGSDGAIELVGIGEADRRWELRIHDIDANRKLVHLADRTSHHIAEKMRVDFVANASHELRTPLATLIGFIETLEDGEAGEDQQTRERFLSIMAAEARRMQRLIDDLISLSRIEADKFSPPEQAVAVARLISEVARAASAGVENDGIIRVEVAPIAPDLHILGDYAQLSQLLHNLIGNALKYGRPETRVQVSAAREDGGMVLITVADQGEGIPAEHLPRLTERFYRVDPGRSRAMGGTGLGLAIVKHIVERHRGRLDIRSEIGVGTTVLVRLPSASDAVS